MAIGQIRADHWPYFNKRARINRSGRRRYGTTVAAKFTVIDGPRVAYREFGQGPDVLFLHGLGYRGSWIIVPLHLFSAVVWS